MHTPAPSSHHAPSYGNHAASMHTPFQQTGTASLFGSPNAELFNAGIVRSPSAATAAAAFSNPFGVSGSNFGSGLFPGSSVVHHFPTAAASLASAGLSRSAQILVELSLTFHGAGLAAAAAGTNPNFTSYKPNVLEVNVMPPPGEKQTNDDVQLS